MINEKRELSRAIKTQARLAGFRLVGITSPKPPPHLEIYNRWLDDGNHGEMTYLATERARIRRSDPCQILPECRSILVLGIPYPAPETPDVVTETPASGQVASYAWGQDYHSELAKRLTDLVLRIETIYGSPVPNRWYTDTGPILEREFAQRAGLGWIGKNTCLINPARGSYFLLAEILLGVDLEPDPPMIEDFCGSCTRCIDACPTGCILPDRTLDARECISYLTIELKTAIPSQLRPLVGDWVFGCDVCQQVCPWNVRFAEAEGDPAFEPEHGREYPNLQSEILLDAQAFADRFRGSPIKRARRAGYLRNVAVALGNSRDQRAVPQLGSALRNDPEPLVRSHAAWALGQLGGSDAADNLNEALAVEIEPDVIQEIQAALQLIENPRQAGA